MSRMSVFVYIVCLFVVLDAHCITRYVRQTVHIFGDSHASWMFSNGHQGKEYAEHSYYEFKMGEDTVFVPFVITWLGPVTMHRIGRDGISYEGIQNEDVVVLVSGEIDVRCHIGKQRDEQGRGLDEIICTLVRDYIAVLLKIRSLKSNITAVVSMVVPPTDINLNPVFPYYGTLDDRINITRKLNNRLKKECEVNGIYFVDKYDFYSTQHGDLRADIAEPGNIHIAYQKPMQDALLDLIIGNLKI